MIFMYLLRCLKIPRYMFEEQITSMAPFQSPQNSHPTYTTQVTLQAATEVNFIDKQQSLQVFLIGFSCHLGK